MSKNRVTIWTTANRRTLKTWHCLWMRNIFELRKPLSCKKAMSEVTSEWTNFFYHWYLRCGIWHPCTTPFSQRTKSTTVVLITVRLEIPDLPILRLLGQWLKAIFFSVLQLNCEMEVKGWIKRCSSNVRNFLSLLKQMTQSALVHHDQS